MISEIYGIDDDDNILIEDVVEGRTQIRKVEFTNVIKALKLYDNLQNHILILLEELSHSSSSQLRFLLEEFIKVRDE